MKAKKPSASFVSSFVHASELRQAEENYKHWEAVVSRLFINALLKHDKATILELANAAEFFKGKIGPDFQPADPLRLKLLQLKGGSAFRRGFTMEEIRKHAGVKATDDGDSALRRVCKSLDIAIWRPKRLRKKAQ